MALAEIDTGLTSLETAYATRLHRWQRATIGRIIKLVQADGASVLEGGLNLHGSLPELRSELLNLRTRITNFGRGQVNEELKRQGSTR